jgi:PRTRC genetic system protein C
MSLKTSPLPREFSYNGLKLPDPGSSMSAEQVRDFYSSTYPEIATAAIEGPEATATALRYTFTRAIGSKG